LCLYVPNSWAAAASDYYVYYPPSTPKWKTFLLTFTGLALSFWFVDILGIGLACGIIMNPDWSDAYDISSGALKEHFIFKPALDWERWADRESVPVGIAALIAFILVWVGAVLGMDQTWFVGPLAEACGAADVGMWVGCAFTLVVYPPLRWWERRQFGR
jgi:purine-cytosine permease-like protein